MTERFFHLDTIRAFFPALQQSDQELHPTIYLDNAATTQKPYPVIAKLEQHYREGSANVHRGSHSLTAVVTDEFEDARRTVSDFLNAPKDSQGQIKNIIWTRGATESINLIAQCYARPTLQPNDEILVSEMEHHANIVSWQIVAAQTGATVVKIPMKPNSGYLDMAQFAHRLSSKTKIVAVSHISNVTGTRNPIEEIIKAAHHIGAIVVVDGAQGIVHEPVDLAKLDADFYVFSGHKLFAPSGIGVLYGKTALLDAMTPWHGGGKMVQKVSFEKTIYAPLPAKFEAGTPNISGALSLATAINWLTQVDRSAAEAHIAQLQAQLITGLEKIDGIQFVGLQRQTSIVSFNIDELHHSDLATLLNQQGIAVRSGQHCAHPLMDAFELDGCIRISIAFYNSPEDINQTLLAIQKACELLR